MDRLRQRADFLAAASALRVATPAFVIQSRRRDDLGPLRVGFTVSKKVGNAVERNRVRRRLCELVRLNGAPLMRPHCDYVLVGRRVALSRQYDSMRQDLAAALTRPDVQMSKRSASKPATQLASDGTN